MLLELILLTFRKKERKSWKVKQRYVQLGSEGLVICIDTRQETWKSLSCSRVVEEHQTGVRKVPFVLRAFSLKNEKEKTWKRGWEGLRFESNTVPKDLSPFFPQDSESRY